MAISNRGGFDDLEAQDDSLVPGQLDERQRKARSGDPGSEEFVAEEPGQADLRKGRDVPTSQGGSESLGD